MKSSEYTSIRHLEEDHWWYTSTHRAVLRELEILAPEAKVLDAGCGTGGLLHRGSGRHRGIGLDAVWEGVRASSVRKNLSGRIIQGSVETLPIGDGRFDAVTCIDVLYHKKVHSESAALSELTRILKPGGRLILQVPALEILRGGHDEAVHTRKRFRISEVRFLLREAGLQIDKIRYRYWWLFLPALAIRWLSRNSSRSDLRPVSPAFNRGFILMSRLGDRPVFSFMPLGTSVFAVGIKR